MPTHRGPTTEDAVKKTLRRSVSYSGIAVAATGIAVSGGVAMKDRAPADSAATTIATAQAQRTEAAPDASLEERGGAVSRSQARSDRRSAEDKDAALQEASGLQVTRTEDTADEDPKSLAMRLMPEYGLSTSEFGCLDALWASESDWNPSADNPTSTAYGIPQALTGGTHGDLPSDYMTNPASQVRWGLGYIEESYGSACAAWEFKQANQWY